MEITVEGQSIDIHIADFSRLTMQVDIKGACVYPPFKIVGDDVRRL